MTNKPLSHLTVIEFASVLAGPLTGSFLAELGAKVIKIENKKTGGDVTRSWRSSRESTEGISAYYAAANTYKQTLFLDLNIPTEKEKALSLVKKADIVLSNFKPESAKKLALTFENFKSNNPTIIHGQIVGFANESNRAAYDVVLQAETGFMSMNGQPENLPTKMPVALIDILAAHQLKEGILLALLQLQSIKKAQQVTVNLEQAAISALANQASNWLMNKQIATQLGSLHPNIAPYGETFLCSDNKYIVLAIGSDKQFNTLCNILKIDHLAKDERFITNQLRVKNRKLLEQVLVKAFKNQKSEQLLNQFIEQNVPAGAVKKINEVMESSAGSAMVISENVNNQWLHKVKNIAFQITN